MQIALKNIAKHYSLTVLFLAFSFFSNAQLYWVGGTGEWSDASHWSYESGGQPANVLPGVHDAVIIDQNSSLNQQFTVDLDSILFCKSLTIESVHFQNFTSSNNYEWLVATSFSLAESFVQNTNGQITFGHANKNIPPSTFKASDYIKKNYNSGKTDNQILAITSLSFSVKNESCSGDCDGEITVSVNGGVGPFSYQWFPNGLDGDGTPTITNLCAGSYTVLVTDSSDFTSVFDNANVQGTAPLTVFRSGQSNVSCFGEADGSITATAIQGTPPYTYLWDDASAQTTPTASGLVAGDYQLTVTDDSGCVAVSSVWTVTEPTVLSSSITDSSNVLCFGECTGTAEVTANGGTGPYDYDWYNAPNGETTDNAADLCSGTYFVEITDNNGCLDTSQVSITEPTQLSISATPSNISCFGEDDGSSTTSVSGGVPSYTYSWYDVPGTPATPTISNLAPGTYHVRVEDDNGCADTAEITITEPALLVLSNNDLVNIDCFGESTGEAEVGVAGGTIDYVYNWYDAPGTPNTARVTNLPAGTYNVQVTDDNGCRDTLPFIITQPGSPLVVSLDDTTNNLCFGECNGIADVSGSGGTPNYSFLWYDAPGTPADTVANNLCSGNYNVEITDNNGCKDSLEVTITEPDELSGSLTNTNVQCGGECNGQSIVTPSGGTAGYTYDWYDAGGITDSTATGLCAGSYNVEITDVNGCIDTVTSTITEPVSLLISIASQNDIDCFGECDGSATTSSSGGTAPYDYLWYDAPGTPTSSVINNLCAGSYNVEITDDNGCKDTTALIITEPGAALTTSITDSINVACFGNSTGEAEVTAVGGTAGYNYDWYDAPGGQTAQRATNLPAGTYNVEVTDNNGCIDTATVIIEEPDSALTSSISDSTNILCFGECTGQAIVEYQGGTGAIAVNWYNIGGTPTTDTVNSLCSGIYNVELTDDNGCKDTSEVNIIQPTQLVTTINSSILPTCYGDCDGSMSVNPSGGTSPYTYSWYDVVGTPTDSVVSDQCAGSYNIAVTDDNGCEDTTTVVLSDPDSLEYTIVTQTNILCKEECTGSAEVAVSGGIPNYTITWYDAPTPGTGTTIASLCDGTYNFQVEDDNGCIDTSQVTITEPALALSSSIIDSTNNLCFGECNGDAEVAAAGGTSPYFYDWYNDPSASTDSVASGLCAGTFNVEITDNNGCLDTAQVNITEPDSLDLTTDVTNVSCNSSNDGVARVTVSGGTPNYSYDWYDAGGSTADSATGLTVGTYHVEVTDNNGCIDTAEVVISEPDALVATIIDSSNVTCFGDCNGAAEVAAVGGSGNYFFNWYDAPGAPTAPTINSLCPGTYNVEVSDDGGCIDTTQITITEPAVLALTADSIQATCNGICDGSASVDVTGGTEPYAYNWYDVAGTPTADSIINQCVGFKSVEVTDSNSCVDTITVEVIAPDVVDAEIADSTNNVCSYDCNGDARVVATGGFGSYTYDWINAPDGDTDSIAENLCNQVYQVVVADANGCQDTADVNITSSSDTIEANESILQPLCNGDANGEIYLAITGGTAPFLIDWYTAGNQTNDTLFNVMAGTHSVEITDNSGCVDTTDIVMPQPDTLDASIVDSTNILCFGENTGDAEVASAGGTGPYTYNWYDVAGAPTTPTVSGLLADTFHVEVTDFNGCLDTAQVIIEESPEVILTMDSTQTTCVGLSDGTASVNVTGGVAPYSYSWYNAPGTPTTDSITGLPIGTYYVEVTDSNGCIDTSSVQVTAPVTVTADIVDSTNLTCYTICNGTARVVPTGGAGGYIYNWFDVPGGDVDSIAENLCAGSYNVEVTDANGCLDTATVNIESPDSIDVVSTLTQPSCNGDSDGEISITISGGVSPYTIDWYTAGNQTNDTITGLTADTYFVEITDLNGCLDTTSIVLPEPDTLVASIIDSTNILCFGENTGDAEVASAGGTGPYNYNWYDVAGAPTTPTVSGLLADTFHVEVTDFNGCLDTAQVIIEESPEVILTMDSTQTTCVGLSDGTASVDVTGGVAPYSYSWYNAPGTPTTDSITGLAAGTYYVEVTDSNGCVDTASVQVTDPVGITASIADSSNLTCYTICNGTARVVPTGGAGGYIYNWFDVPGGDVDSIAENLCAGSYNVEVTDANGCLDTATVNIESPDSIDVVSTLTQPSCNGDSDGEISIAISGGVSPYTIDWYTAGNQTNDTITGLTADTYFVEITDSNGCLDTTSIVLPEPDTLLVSIIDTTEISCFDGNNGALEALATGGTGPYTYRWYNAPGAPTANIISGLSAGTYNVEATDLNGCLDTVAITLEEPDELAYRTDSIQATCSGVCDGAVILTIDSGGTAPFTLNWYTAGGANTDTVRNLCAGTYPVEITDFNGCVDTVFVGVTEVVSVTVSLDTMIPNTCPGGADGQGMISGSGGTLPYSYWWSDAINQTNDTATGLPADSYRAAIIDSNGCSDTIDVVVTEPVPIQLNTTLSDVLCKDQCNGAIITSPSGGTGPYTHSWSTGSNSPSIAGLCAGTYTDTITDNVGCMDTVSLVINEPDSLIPTAGGTNLLCFNDSSGTAFVDVIGGSAPYTFSWNDPNSSTLDSVVGLAAGEYIVEVTDSNGCMSLDTVTITEPTQLIGTITDTIQANCICNGEATVTPAGGTSPYTYAWNDIASQTDSTAINLCVGDYEVVVTDSNSCTDTVPVSIRDTSAFTIAFTDTVLPTCYGDCDGAATVTPDSGIAPYTFIWNDPANTTDSTVTGLCAGTYNVTVTDSIGCIRVLVLNLGQPDSVTGAPNFQEPLCFGDTNGIAWVVPSGGTGPYTHSWSTGSTNDSIFNIGIGTYTDTITDANGCQDTVQVIVTQPTLLSLNPQGQDISCFNAGDGSVWSGVSGGTTPYTYLWNDAGASTSDTLQNLDPGTYTVFVSDNNGCSDTDSVAITQPLPLTSSIVDSSNVNCTCTGEATVRAVGGTTPYAYQWNDINNQTDSTAINLCAGNYQVIITDSNNCLDTSNVLIEDTSSFVAQLVDTTMASCFGSCNGGAVAVADSGITPYNFLYNDPAATTDSIVNGLCAGNYFVTISDAAGCTRNIPFTITQPDSIDIVIPDAMASCFDSCDASLIAAVSGGTAPYTYLWDDPSAQTADTASNLCAGNYQVMVVDSQGCRDSATAAVAQPAELIPFIQTLQNISCNGQDDGLLTASQLGGTSPYTYNWSNGDATATTDSLSPGIYIVTVTDTNGCVADTNATIIEPSLLTSSIVDSTNVLCNGDNSGSATVRASGGTAPYTYSWYDSPNNGTDSVENDLTAGTFNVQITDANGCVDTATVNITQPVTPLSISVLNQTATSCLVCDGTLAVEGQGGVAPYSYQWTNIAGNPTDSSVTGLCAQNYTVEVTDTNGCVETQSIAITGPGGLSAQISDSTMVSCFGACDGSAQSQALGGDAPYTYSWDDLSATTTDSVQNLCPGNYEVTVTDSSGCLAYAQVTIVEPAALVASIIDTTSSGCTAPCSGSATAGVTGGNGGYTYVWNDPANQMTAIASNLCAGAYIVNVTDSLGCSDTTVAHIAGPNLFTVSVDSVRHVSCNSICDGYAEITATGGAGNYTYLWNDLGASTSPTVTGLCAGTYTVTVTDNNGCEAFASVTIVEPNPLNATISDSINLTCFGDGSGSAVVAYSGGTSPYSILWNDLSAQITDTASNLSAGVYSVTVTDTNGCVATDQVTITEPTQITASLVSKTDVTCSGFCTGDATISASGGTGSLNITWSPTGQTGLTASNLCTGWHTYTITDDSGCTLIDSVEIVDLNALTVDVSGTDVTCNSACDGTASASVLGGVSPYSHSWNNGATAVNLSTLCPGNYIDTVTDFNGCFVIDSVLITEPDSLLALFSDSMDASCNGLCDGSATIRVSGGTAPYQYDWTNAPGATNDSIANNLCSGDYYVEITDSNNCIYNDTITINEPTAITTSVDNVQNTTCFGDCDGEIQVSASGGIGTLDYSWDNGDNGQLINGLCANRYLLTVTDDSSCTDTTSVLITQPDSIDLIISDTTHIVCSGLPQGEAVALATGGTGALTYNWNDPSNTVGTTATNLVAGDYQVIVTDVSGCTDTANVTINEDNVLAVSINRTDVSCNGDCDGVLEAVPTGGVAPYNISWNTGDSDSLITGLCPAFYNVSIEDDEGCNVASAEQITEPTVLDVTIATSDDPTCNGLCNGEATAAANGGTAPYNYLWNNATNETNALATGLCAQTYKVVSTDGNGCQDSITVSLTEPSAIVTTPTSNDATCSNTTDGSAGITATGGTTPYVYSWFNNNGYLNNNQNPTGMGIGKYYISVSDSNGCSELDSVTINEQFFVMADAGADRVLCDGDTINLSANGGISYEWSTGETNANITITPTNTQSYYVIAYNNVCSDTDSVNITVNSSPLAEVTTSSNIILEGTTAELNASGAGTNGTYSWDPPIGLSDPTMSNPIADPDVSTTYVVTVENQFGCIDTAQIRIRVEETIIFPDGITPNKDGFNDDWRILLIEEFPNAKVEVYNRWGQRVFESIGYNERWDGNFNGKPLPVGTYYYVIDLGNGLPKYTGPITIMR